MSEEQTLLGLEGDGATEGTDATHDQTQNSDADGTANAAAEEATADDSATDDTTDTDGDDGAGDGEQAGAPEAYEDFAIPEGLGLEVDEKRMASFKDLAKGLNLSQDAAQTLVDEYTQAIPEIAAAAMEAATQAAEQKQRDQAEAWAKESREHPDIGGSSLEGVLARGNRVLGEYGTPSLIEALKQTGMSNHPDMIQLLNRVGTTLEEDRLENGKPPASTQTTADRWYPNNQSAAAE